jgi:SAM-dependent methyltransferase
MPYADKTFRDRNPVKRYLQQRRLRDALHAAPAWPDSGWVVDLGAGNGELCRQLLERIPAQRLVCYEPHPELIEEARRNIGPDSGVRFCRKPAELPSGPASLVFCLEVFEHLPPKETEELLDLLQGLLGRSGKAVIGVPIETGLPALGKGLFRMSRRYGEYDARPGHVLRAALGRPPKDRPVVELMPGKYFHLHHLGFDLSGFEEVLARRFNLLERSCSPFRVLGRSVNSEAYFLVDGGPGGR